MKLLGRHWIGVACGLLAVGGVTALLTMPGGCERTVQIKTERSPEIRYRDIQRGLGPQVEEGRMVHVHYIGRLPDGEIFLDTREKASPHKWIVGQGTVIEGMDRAVVGMRPGGVRQVTIPPELHWGRAGYADIVPENATLKFELTLVAVN